MNKVHLYFYKFMRAAIVPYFRYIAHHSWEKCDPKSETYLVLTNHNTNWDFFLFGLSFPRHMYFVASEHIYRLGFVSKIIKFLGGPIPRKKGASGDDTVRMIKERLDEGYNVCMMAEGNRSFNGETGFISPRTAVLAKECGAGLVTYRLHGGYLQNPRWGSEVRKGRTYGELVNEYTAEELQNMSTDEIYEALTRDLYVDAYADQKVKPEKYTCKHPAEHLETALFVCPECKSFSALESRDDRFFCKKCGLELRLDDYGYFKGEKVPFETILDWDRWQKKYLHEYLPTVSDTETALFSDDGLRLSAVNPGEGTTLLVQGRLSMYKDRMEVSSTEKTVSFRLEDIQKISVSLTDTMLFTASGKYYEIKSEKPYSALKYLISSRLLIGKEYV